VPQLPSVEAALTAQADQALADNRLGMAALERGQLDSARLHFEAAIAADPSAPALWINLATVFRRGGDDESEKAALLGALDLDQRHFMANLRLAELHERLEEMPQAAMRWSLVLGLAAQAGALPVGLEIVLAHGREVVEQHRSKFADAIDAGLESARAQVEAKERRRFDACIEAMLGRRRIHHNECAGLHVPFLPADEIFDRSLFPWLERLEASTSLIRAELEALLAGRAAWSDYFLWRDGRRIDEARRRCPRTAAILESLPCAQLPGRAPTAFFWILRPGARIASRSGVSNARAIVHLPLIVPQGCGSRVGGERREWRAGEAFAFDETIEHEAWNGGCGIGAVLAFDVWNPHLTDTERGLLQTFFAMADQSGFNPPAARIAG
jgi:hypothetical protein